ncbi:MAG: hypothetical protein GY946_15665, partial [bacterium]|nr:hypothetical protein [bacterium]
RREKLVYLIFAPHADDLQKQLLQDVAPRLLELDPRSLSMNIDDADASVPAPVPWPAEELPFVAEVSLWVDCHDRRGPFERILAEVGERRDGYLVSESLYTDYGGNRHSKPRDWPDGQRSPGVLTVTLLRRPARMDHAAWIEHWHGTQSPESEAIQPRTRYVRNEVVRGITPDAPSLQGIVDEAWPTPAHITDPMLFYLAEGSPERMKANIERMMASVTAFLDLDRIRNVTMSEYLLKTPRD